MVKPNPAFHFLVLVDFRFVIYFSIIPIFFSLVLWFHLHFEIYVCLVYLVLFDWLFFCLWGHMFAMSVKDKNCASMEITMESLIRGRMWQHANLRPFFFKYNVEGWINLESLCLEIGAWMFISSKGWKSSLHIWMFINITRLVYVSENFDISRNSNLTSNALMNPKGQMVCNIGKWTLCVALY